MIHISEKEKNYLKKRECLWIPIEPIHNLVKTTDNSKFKNFVRKLKVSNYKPYKKEPDGVFKLTTKDHEVQVSTPRHWVWQEKFEGWIKRIETLNIIHRQECK